MEGAKSTMFYILCEVLTHVWYSFIAYEVDRVRGLVMNYDRPARDAISIVSRWAD